MIQKIRPQVLFLRKKFGDRFLRRAQTFTDKPGLSIVADALLANKVARIHAMHNPTAGGLATGILELAKNGIECTQIGKFTRKSEGLRIFKKGKLVRMPIFKVDEIAKVL